MFWIHYFLVLDITVNRHRWILSSTTARFCQYTVLVDSKYSVVDGNDCSLSPALPVTNSDCFLFATNDNSWQKVLMLLSTGKLLCEQDRTGISINKLSLNGFMALPSWYDYNWWFFSLHARIWGKSSTIHCLLCCFFFFQVENRSCAPAALFGPDISPQRLCELK